MENKFILPQMQVMITTEDSYIEGIIEVPDNIKFASEDPDSILFYILNGGFQFVTLKNCEVRDRKNFAFRPENIPKAHINVASIELMQLQKVLPHDEKEVKYGRRKDDIT